MGRIKTQGIKAKTQEIFEMHREHVSSDYGKNKEMLKANTDIQSKKLTNVIAGYLTRLAKADN